MHLPDHNHKWAFRLLRIFCPSALVEEIEGDLEQKYRRDVVSFGKRRAEWRLLMNTIRFFRSGIVMRNQFRVSPSGSPMLKHFVKVFFRAAWRDKTYSLLNLSGLAISLVASMFMLLWILDEVSYDNFHADGERIFKVMSNHAFSDGIETMDDSPGPLVPALTSLPEVEEACRIIRFGVRPMFTLRGEPHFEEGMYADPSALRVFTIPILAGDRNTPLAGIHDIMISRTLSEKYFPGGNAVGQAMRMDGKEDMRVTAVFENMPEHSTLKFDFILPFELYASATQYVDEWGAWAGGESMVKLRSASQRAVVEEKIHELFTKPNIWVRWDDNVTLSLFPLGDWRLHSEFRNGVQQGGRITYVMWLGGATVFILLVACANFMNMSTARSLIRSKEVGIRKVIGAMRPSLILQFMIEALALSVLACVLAIFLFHLLLPAFNTLTGKQLTIDYTNPWVAGGMFVITIITGLIAGIYPAFFLSAGGPVSMMKKTGGNSAGYIRRGLVVFQFTLSTILIVGSLVVYQQINFMRKMDLGFDRTGVFFMPYREGIASNFTAFREAALSTGIVTDITRAGDNPMRVFGGMVLPDDGWPGKKPEEEFVFQVIGADERFVDFMKINIVAGRNFSAGLPGDSTKYLISEETARLMKLKEPIGATIAAHLKGEVIGVVKDFHTRELREPIQPVIIRMMLPKEGFVFMRYAEGKLAEAIRLMDGLHRQFEPAFPSQIQFMDDSFNDIYKDEIMVGQLVNIFTCIAIVISCLGLFGLVSFAAQRRRKEIGIRKVLGAEVLYLVGLLCRDFALLIGVSLVIGIPLAWYGVDTFLNRFTYHTAPGLSVVVYTVVALFAVALLAVVFQSMKAARENPVNVLRSE